MLEALQEGLLREEFDPDKLELVTTSNIYKGRAADVIPAPKVEAKHPGVNFQELVYPRLGYGILEAEPRDILFCLVHNIQPTRERMFEQNRTQDATCPHQDCAGRIQDREHIFCSCTLVSPAWVWLRTRLLRYFPTTVGAGGTTSEDFLLLCFPRDLMDKELVWLIGNYCDIVVKQVLGKKRKLTATSVSAIMKSRLSSLQTRKVIVPQIFNI